MNDLGPCGKHPRKIAETPSQAWHRAYESPNADKDPSQHCPECDRDAALRQSAAPYGGLTVESLAKLIRRVDGSHSLGAGALAEALIPLLAQESKTGAVTETK